MSNDQTLQPYKPKMPLTYTCGKHEDWRRHDDWGQIRDVDDFPVLKVNPAQNSENLSKFREKWFTGDKINGDPCREFAEFVVAAVNQHAALLAEVATLKAQRDKLRHFIQVLAGEDTRDCDHDHDAKRYLEDFDAENAAIAAAEGEGN